LHRRDLLLRLELGSNPEVLCVVRSAVEQLANAIGFSAPQCREVTRAVDEALANIIRHAYRGRPNRPIAITCYRARHSKQQKGRDCLEIILEDRGAAADRSKLGGRPLDEVRPGGLGMHFIREGIDAMQYRRMSRKNWLRLMKYLPPANREQSSMKETRP
jgi:anti-sigma regulatory factor (Ser/Thr protein kinase)